MEALSVAFVAAAVVLVGVAGVAWFVGAVSTSLRWQRRMDAEQKAWAARWREEREKHDRQVFARWNGARMATQDAAGERAA